MNRRRKTTKQFIAELAKINFNIEVLGDYAGALNPIRVYCKKCGYIWTPVANSLKRGHGCPKCAKLAPYTTDEFKEKLAEVNPNIEVIGEYKNSKTSIKVRCKKCDHVWSPKPNDLLRSKGCPKCAHCIHKTTKQFKAELKKINPNIEIVGEYTNANTPICVRCKKCGHVWQPLPNNLLRGHGCPKCAGRIPKTTEEFKKELAKVNSNIEVIGEYVGANKPIKVRCKKCGHVWSPIPHSLLQKMVAQSVLKPL